MDKNYYRWRPKWYHNSNFHQRMFIVWLQLKGALILDKTSKSFNEKIKFKIGKREATYWATGYCCPFFSSTLMEYKTDNYKLLYANINSLTISQKDKDLIIQRYTSDTTI